MEVKSLLGVHHRSDGDLISCAKEAKALGAGCMQIFVSDASSGRVMPVKDSELEYFFKVIKSSSVEKIFVHATFRVSLTTSRASVLNISRRSIYKELEVCDRIGASALVVHPGSAKDQAKTRDDPYGIQAGVETMAEQLNKVTSKDFKTKILIENTAYARSTVGSNLNDFLKLREMLEFPEKVGFCLDLSHAFAYGYPIDPVDEFVKLVDSTMGLQNVELIHLNDSATKLGSRIDQHKIPGQGYIGEATVRDFVQVPSINNIPMIMELPMQVQQKEIQRAMEQVGLWLGR